MAKLKKTNPANLCKAVLEKCFCNKILEIIYSPLFFTLEATQDFATALEPHQIILTDANPIKVNGKTLMFTQVQGVAPYGT